MYPRVNYEMTQEDLNSILEASRPTLAMFGSGGTPLFGTPQENANRAWQSLGQKMGFDHMTVKPIQGADTRFFSAIPSENETQRMERLMDEADKKKQADITALRKQISDAQEKLKALEESPCANN